MEILSNYKLTNIDLKFINYLNEYINRYPFRWYYFINIFSRKDIVYIKDTTIIINLLKLDSSKIIKIFKILKDLLRDNIIKQIKYQKEVIIIYFYNKFMIDFFSDSNKWMFIPFLKILDNKRIKYYLNPYLKINEEIISYYLMINYKSIYVTIDISDSEIVFDKHIHLVLNFYNNENHNLKFSFDKDKFFLNFLNHLGV